MLFILGLLFKYWNISGASILLTISLPPFILGYLPVNYLVLRRKASNISEKSFLVLKFITFSTTLLSTVMIIQHWPGGGLLQNISMVLVAMMIILFGYLVVKRHKLFLSGQQSLLVAVLLLGIFFNKINPRSSLWVLENYSLTLDLYEKQNAGIASSIQTFYKGLYFVKFEGQPVIREDIHKLKLESEAFFAAHQTLKQDFISFTNSMVSNGRDTSGLLSKRSLNAYEPGWEFFIEEGRGEDLKIAVEAYHTQVMAIVKEQKLAAGLIGMGLDVADVEDEVGNKRQWEVLMFANQPVSSVMNNLAWIRQMALRTEASVLTGLVNQADLSSEVLFLQEVAAMEAEKTMDLKENEIIRIRQQQKLQSLLLDQSQIRLHQRKTTIITAFAVIAFVLGLLIIATRAFYLKRKDNKKLAFQKKEITQMNDSLNQRNEEIMAQRDEIEAQRDMVYKQKEQIEKSHEEISSSIDYAKRLQTSILPSPGLLNTRISDHFVLFRPKHRVSGDFYWWTQVEDHVVIAAVDCTGHGVPGAFMSMLGVSMLREIVSKEYISHPGVILRRLRKEVMHALKQVGELGEQKDGMDMALVSINAETLECQYAGANNPLYLVRKGELTEYKADRMPIAIHQNMAKFTTHDIQLEPGDQLYLASDGYVDQFGGPLNKKFMPKAFRKLLSELSILPMIEQKQALEYTLSSWMGSNEQVDDIVVLGLKV